jgi:hypothetical protein
VAFGGAADDGTAGIPFGRGAFLERLRKGLFSRGFGCAVLAGSGGTTAGAFVAGGAAGVTAFRKVCTCGMCCATSSRGKYQGRI